MQPVDAAAASHDFWKQAQPVEHGQARGLQDQAGTQRLRLLEALENRDAVARAMQEQGRGKAGRAGAGNCDME